ncbi:lipoprotein LpqH [Micropruina sp.]|uniref:lipoprotein LpqH n=1 Tax=Micropruina sp. TaxID=2737536 RepID=UPI0039E33743
MTTSTWLRTVALTAGLALAVTGCAKTQPGALPGSTATRTASDETPAPSATPTPSETAPTTTTPSGSTSPTPSPTGSSGPAVKAGGTLKLYAQASKKLAGTCQSKAGDPTLTVADHKNDFFNTIDVTLVLTGTRKSVSSLTIALGEDSELITRTLTYHATGPASGTSAKLTVKGAAYTVTGKLASAEDGTAAGTMPVTLTITCASTQW